MPSNEESTEVGRPRPPELHGSRDELPSRMLPASLLLLSTWLGVNAVWGSTGPTDTLASGWMRAVGPLSLWIGGAAGVLALASMSAAMRRKHDLLVVACMLLAYLLGVLAGEHLQAWLQPASSLVHRSFLLTPAIPMLAVCWISKSRDIVYPLGFGNWSVRTRWFGDRESTWSRCFAWSVLFLGLPAILLMQAGAGFTPILSGKLWRVLPLILALSGLNAFAEELLFRGLMLPPLVSWLGGTQGLWAHSLLFGFLHFGASPSPVADFPMAILLVFLGALFGKSALDTGGLGWAICLHAILDVATLSVALVE